MDSDDCSHVHDSMNPDSTSLDQVSLAALGWRPYFAEQASPEGLSATHPARVVAVHRSGLRILGAGCWPRRDPARAAAARKVLGAAVTRAILAEVGQDVGSSGFLALLASPLR